MDTHDALDRDQAHDTPRIRPPAGDSATTALPEPGLGNAALSRLLGGNTAGGVDRAATKTQGAGPLDEDIAADINAARGGGQSMDDSTKADMEGHLGVDLGGVRVHTGSQADGLSRSVQAEAFTTGSDIFFRSGAYQPNTSDGRRLLAHELTHVVQQASGTGGPGGRVSHPDDPHEREASAVGDAVASSEPATAPASADAGSGPAVNRTPEEDEEVATSPAADRAPEEEEEVATSPAAVDREAAPEEEEADRTPIDREQAPDEEEEPAA